MIKIIFYIFSIICSYLFLFGGYTGGIQIFIAYLTIFCVIYARKNHECIMIN